MGVIAFELDIFVLEVFEGFDFGVELELWSRARFTGELFVNLFEVVAVDVQVSEGVNELAGFEPGDLRQHAGQECVGGDVERDSQKEVRASLVELAGEFSFHHEELEERVAGWQCHLGGITWVPSRDYVASGVGVVLEVTDQLGDLIHAVSFRSGFVRGASEVPPGVAIDGPKVAFFPTESGALFFGRPFVPDGDLVLIEPLVVGATG